MGRQLAFGVGVVEVVRDVGEPGVARLKAFDPMQSLIDIGVAGMRPFAQRVDDEDAEVLQQRQAGVGDDVHVGEISSVPEAEACHLLLAVDERHALESGSVNGDGFLAFETVHADAGAGRIFRFGREGIVEDSLDDGGAGVVGIKRHVAVGMMEGERAQIIEAEDVVGVGVGVEDGIDVADFFAQNLFAEVRAGVDEDTMVFPLNGGGGAQAAISRIRRGADVAFASERGDAH